jgi:hypothetical protein
MIITPNGFGHLAAVACGRRSRWAGAQRLGTEFAGYGRNVLSLRGFPRAGLARLMLGAEAA